jgi:ABC-type antimicrobial peptide transport system permease subunit
MSLIARVAGDPHALIDSVRREIQALDDNLPVQEIKTLDELAGFHLWPTRMCASLLGGFGLLGLLLATVGVYGVISYSVTQRTREIGVRMALGAQPRDVLKLIVRQGMALTLIGAAIGVAMAWAAMRLLASLLYGVSAADLPTFVGVPIFLIGVALFACYLPASRAMKIDPMMALRRD